MPVESINFDHFPATEWEYYQAWIQCVKIRQLAKELQERMLSGVNIHELVEAPTLDKLAEEMHQLWWHTAWKEEDLQLKYFGKLWNWEKKAKQHYSNFRLILNTRVVDNRPEYKLIFQDKWNGEIISQSNQLPVQIDWCPVESFFQDTRRYDCAENLGNTQLNSTQIPQQD